MDPADPDPQHCKKLGLTVTFLAVCVYYRFSCKLAVTSGREYRVEKVSPEMDMETLVRTLNANNDISGFVVALRKRFLASL